MPPIPSGYGKELSGPSDQYKDVAADIQYQYVGDLHTFSLIATHIHETQTLDGSSAAEVVGNATNDLTTLRGFATYYYRRKIGGTVGLFKTTGSTDAIVAPNSPDTSGWVAEINYLPWLNTKFGLQYTAYSKFAGLGTNYDGMGRKASDNNTLYLSAWLSY